MEFKDSLFNAAESTIRSSLDELMGEVQAQGERLARHQNFEELSKYKELVRAFLAKAAKDLYRLQSSDGGAAGAGRPGGKVYVILEKVDLELEKLAKMVLAGQSPQLRILEKLDQIKGLLLTTLISDFYCCNHERELCHWIKSKAPLRTSAAGGWSS